ncbi:hypothetical protein VSU19_20840 [Verrucomicrobiales bacterium BCK34]|nr:hypothetical protein [Verrucomicrobiales bacterium BCK34]
MAWRWNDDTAWAANNFAFAPSGGSVKLVVLGFALPSVIFYFAIKGWITQEALWIGRDNDQEVSGVSAQAISVAYFGVGLVCHIRWFWGLLGFGRIFEVGTILSVILILAGLAYGFYWELRF